MRFSTMRARFSTLVLASALASSPIHAAPNKGAPMPQNSRFAEGLCQNLTQALVAATPEAPQGGVFLRSYDKSDTEIALPHWLEKSAFTYDNALASIALGACGRQAEALRIADAFLYALDHDRSFHDGRLRNAYQPGSIRADPVPLPGWWDQQHGLWAEDEYQDSSASGNMAWAALALLHAEQISGNEAYADGAMRLLGWVEQKTGDTPGPAGYAGGVSGFDQSQVVARWKATEHNIDIAAAAGWLARAHPEWQAMACKASGFVASRFQPQQGYFLLGTVDDGSDAPLTQHALDSQLWPILAIAQHMAESRRAVLFADTHLRGKAGMTFAGIGQASWNEGTAQAALSLYAIGETMKSEQLLRFLSSQTTPNGLIYATDGLTVDTGLKVEGSGNLQFLYGHRPHIGATAWTILAALRWNPFTGKSLIPAADAPGAKEIEDHVRHCA